MLVLSWMTASVHYSYLCDDFAACASRPKPLSALFSIYLNLKLLIKTYV